MKDLAHGTIAVPAICRVVTTEPAKSAPTNKSYPAFSFASSIIHTALLSTSSTLTDVATSFLKSPGSSHWVHTDFLLDFNNRVLD